MAKGLHILPHYKPKLALIPSGLSVFSTNFNKVHTFFNLRKKSHVRLFCNCSFNPQNEQLKYKEMFENRMAMAGLKPHHRIAVGVSGGPDSMALCLLAADWKISGLNRGKNDFIDGLLGIIVDHGLRAESKNEAEMVRRRVLNIGIRCEIAHCKWTDGKPKLGHLQEAARDMRYENLQRICSQHQIGALLIAHHADDQAELFILRLSRNSGVLGLAGMALTSQLFASAASNDGTSNSVLIIRPLLDFSKQDLYKICEGGKRDWVEDPTNQNTKFARNRIRMSLGNLSSSIFKFELQALISACRKTRSYVDQICQTLINEAVTVMPEGYAVIDLYILNPSEIPDICLAKFVTLLLQFISQRQRTVRGSAQKLLLDYVRSIPCKSCFTAAGCYLCAAPGSKGTKMLICCSVNSALPMNMQSFYINSSNEQKSNVSNDLSEIIDNGKSYSNKTALNLKNALFLNTTSSDSVLTEAKRVKILSEPTYSTILSLQKTESEKFKLKPDTLPDHVSQKEDKSVSAKEIRHGEIGHFMDRFLVSWELESKNGTCCGFDRDSVMEVRHMSDSDWLYLSKISKSENSEDFGHEKCFVCSDFVQVSARKALLLMKSIPVAARRSLPVLVNPLGQVISIPSVCFTICPCLKASADFRPRVPLGGGYSSFL